MEIKKKQYCKPIILTIRQSVGFVLTNSGDLDPSKDPGRNDPYGVSVVNGFSGLEE